MVYKEILTSYWTFTLSLINFYFLYTAGNNKDQGPTNQHLNLGLNENRLWGECTFFHWYTLRHISKSLYSAQTCLPPM